MGNRYTLRKADTIKCHDKAEVECLKDALIEEGFKVSSKGLVITITEDEGYYGCIKES